MYEVLQLSVGRDEKQEFAAILERSGLRWPARLRGLVELLEEVDFMKMG